MSPWLAAEAWPTAVPGVAFSGGALNFPGYQKRSICVTFALVPPQPNATESKVCPYQGDEDTSKGMERLSERG